MTPNLAPRIKYLTHPVNDLKNEAGELLTLGLNERATEINLVIGRLCTLKHGLKTVAESRA